MMEINQQQRPDDAWAEKIALLESELAQMKSSIEAIRTEGAKKTDLMRADSNVYVAIRNSQYTILLCILLLMILSNAVYPIVHACT